MVVVVVVVEDVEKVVGVVMLKWLLWMLKWLLWMLKWFLLMLWMLKK